ncbi:MAG: DMT family transporter [Rhizobiaceae bacterium]|nr:DMT family transporter [Rhizobiaceae bacterium]
MFTSEFPSLDQDQQTPVSAYFLGLVAVIIFGSTLPVTTLALESFTPGFVTSARAVIAASLAFVFMAFSGLNWRHKENNSIFLAGLLLVFGFPGFVALAMQTVDASHGGIILGFLPLATAVIARFTADERPSPRFWILTFTGFLVIVAFTLYQSGKSAQVSVITGYAWLFLAGLCTAWGYVISGKLSRSMPGWEVITRALVLNSPISIVGAIWFYAPADFDPSPSGLIALGYLGAFSMFLGFCAWNVALATGGIARIAQFQLLQIFVTLGVSVVLLGETIDWVTLASALTITAIIATSRRG